MEGLPIDTDCDEVEDRCSAAHNVNAHPKIAQKLAEFPVDVDLQEEEKGVRVAGEDLSFCFLRSSYESRQFKLISNQLTKILEGISKSSK